MYEILWHGRGGQGAFTAAKLLSAAWTFKDEENKALAFPSFGPERRGAPVRAFSRLGTGSLGDRSQIRKANYLVFLDDTLFDENAYDELKDNGKIILCTKEKIEDERIICIDGQKIALELLKRPITNTVVLGALLRAFDAITIEDLIPAVNKLMSPKIAPLNLEAIKRAYEEVA
ncbi:MAG: 2-oxoacid:acceptor oxidoreductase family protein [Succinivibrio dextrinosolvens]|nr:2-oxoacid:acceptor oxidoreductase family protein [Succinivibrio dextrinosolvens]